MNLGCFAYNGRLYGGCWYLLCGPIVRMQSVFTPLDRLPQRGKVSTMNTFPSYTNEAETDHEPMFTEHGDEPLFGDPAWVSDRLQALQSSAQSSALSGAVSCSD